MPNLTSSLTLKLIDDVSGPGKRVSEALAQAEKQAKALANSGLGNKFGNDLVRLGLGAKEIDKVSAAFKGHANAAGIAGKASSWTKEQVSQVRLWESATVAALRNVRREHEALARTMAEKRSIRNAAIGGAAMGASAIALHKGKDIGKKAVVSAAEFDIGVRKQRAFTDISADDQSRLIEQAKKIGQETQFSNLDVVKAQTKSMQGLPSSFSPKLKAEVAEGILENVKNYAMAMEADLETSAEAIRGYLQATGKDISTKSKALAEANKASNQLVKMAKIGGMSDEDVQQFMKFAASSGTTAGLSSETMMSLAALARRGGLRGDEAGTFVRSASAKMVSPTKQGIAALNAAGINFSDYVKMPGKLDVSQLEGQFKIDQGKSFTPEVRARLEKLLADKAVIGDRGTFTEKVTEAVQPLYGKTKKGKMAAADRAKIAKTAGQFHKLSAETVDTEGLLDAAMTKKMTLAQLNAWLTDKHGGKGAITQRQWDEFRTSRETLKKTGDDPEFAAKIAKEIMGGLGGSFENLKGSVENVILSLGQAFDGPLKAGMDKVGNLLDSFSNLSTETRQVAALFAGLVAAGGGIYGAVTFMKAVSGGFGLNASAAQLSAAATALDAAAAKLAGGSVISDAAKGAPAAAGAASRLLPALARGGGALGAAGALFGAAEIAKPTTPLNAPYRLDQAITPEMWEKARRAQQELKQGADMEGARGRAMMRSFGPLEGLGTQADAVKQKLGALEETVTPKINPSSLDTALQKAEKLKTVLASLGSMADQAASSATKATSFVDT